MPQAVTAEQPLRIGQLADASGTPPKTLRYYEEIGLLRPDGHTESGYRMYSEKAVERLRFVRRAKSLGLSLKDIGEILAISDAGRVPCEHVVGVIDRELERIAEQMAGLTALREDLTGLRRQLTDALASGATKPGKLCPCLADGL